jgi:hypothetical protein
MSGIGEMTASDVSSQPRRHPLRVDRVGMDAFPARSPVLRVEAFWRRAAAISGALPSLDRLDLSAVDPSAAAWIFLLDVVREGAVMDFRFRLIGAGNVLRFRVDPTGRLASDIFGSVGAEQVLDAYRETVEALAPTFWIAAIPNRMVGEVLVHRGLFPLATDGRSVDALLGASAPWPPTGG